MMRGMTVAQRLDAALTTTSHGAPSIRDEFTRSELADLLHDCREQLQSMGQGAVARIPDYDKTYGGGMGPGLRPSIERFARWLDGETV